jgi:putative ABC transport system permease protein
MILINALKSIAGSKGRNILIGIIVVTIAASAAVALAIMKAATDAEENGLESTEITGTIGMNTEALMQQAQEQMGAPGESSASSGGGNYRTIRNDFQSLSLEEQIEYADSDYVKTFYYSDTVSLNGTTSMEAVGADETQETADVSQPQTSVMFGGGSNGPISGNSGPMVFGGFAMGDFSVIGYSSEEAMTSFIEGTSVVEDGEVFDVSSSDLDCLISEELALYNDLSVGDTFVLANPSNEEETYEFTIVGLYSTTTASDDSGMGRIQFSTSSDPANQIYISYPALAEILSYSAENSTTVTDTNGYEQDSALSGQLSATYVFANKDDYDAFAEELTAKGLDDTYALSSSDINSYEQSLIPLRSLSSFAKTLLLIILAAGAVVLIVISLFNIRERKYEVGVLTAIGIKKGKVAAQFVTELLIVTILAIFIGTGIGAIGSVPIANKLLASQIEAQQTQATGRETNFGREAPSFTVQTEDGGGPVTFGQDRMSADYLDSVNATLDMTILGELILLGVVLTILASLSAVVFIMRYEPLKILADRT